MNFSGGRGVSVGVVSNTVSSRSFWSHMPNRLLLDGQKVLSIAGRLQSLFLFLRAIYNLLGFVSM